MEDMYRCIRCRESDWIVDNSRTLCAACRASYPSVEGVRVFLPEAGSALLAYQADHAALSAQLRERRDAIGADIQRLRRTHLGKRADQMVEAIDANLALMGDTVQPLERQCEEVPSDPFFAWLSVQTGMSFHDMLIYFYEDWSNAPEFAEARSALTGAALEHRRERKSIAVLGAAACGMAHAFAEHFDQVCAVDLALPTLMLAKRFIAGQPMRVHVPSASWARVDLTPPAEPRRNIDFMVANVMNLPFRDGSQSAVVTQCLLNVAGNPLQFAEEIRRVLAPGGIWLNFSHAFQVPGDPLELGHRKVEELPALFADLGFEIASLERKRFAMLDTTPIDADTIRTEEAVQFFVLRKSPERAVPTPFCTLRDRFERRDPVLWSAVPRFIPGRPLTLADRRVYLPDGPSSETVLGIGGVSLPIPPEFAGTLGALFELVDGQRTLKQIFEVLRTPEPALSDGHFLRLMHCLSIERYLLEFSPASLPQASSDAQSA